MPTINISVENKVAKLTSDSVIVCGNSDYTIEFDFDSEWDDFEAKTVRVAYIKKGRHECVDVLFENSTVTIPAVYGVQQVAIGVYAENIHTTTPAFIPCEACITDGEPVHQPPTPDVYNQLLEYLAGLQGGGGIPAEVITISAENSALLGADIYGTSNAVYPEMTEGHSIEFVQGEWNYSSGIGGPLYVDTGNIGKTVMCTTPYILKAGKKYTITCTTQYMWMRGIFVDSSLRVAGDLGWQTMPTVINGASWSEDKALVLSIANERWYQNPTNVANATTVSIE